MPSYTPAANPLSATAGRASHNPPTGLQGSNRVNSANPSFTKIFYLVLASLTLLAAAVQWLPDEGFPPDIDLGAGEARAQSPQPAPITAGIVPQPVVAPPPAYPATPYVPQPVVYAPPAAPSPSQPMPDSAPIGEFSVPPWMQNNVIAASAVVPPAPVVASPPNTAILVPGLPVHPEHEPPPQELQVTRVLARVGGEVILEGEVLASVNGYLSKNGVNPNEPALQEQKAVLMKMRLKQLIDTKMVVNEAKQKIPPEGYKKAMERFDEEFYESIAPQMATDRKLPDVAALEVQLRKDGTTLEREKRNFAEMVLCNSYLQQNVHVSKDVTHAEMLQYYQEHAAEYDRPAEARWEQIMLRFDAFGSKAEAYAALAQLGNQIVAGRPFADAARSASHGTSASHGGEHPWTKQGSLVSEPLDRAVFSLPTGTLSPIIEDDKGFHIIRVIERRDAGRVPFTEAQVGIRKKIEDQRTREGEKQLIEQIRNRTKVWTIFDESAVETAAQQQDDRRYR